MSHDDMSGNNIDPIDGLKENALSSYGDNRQDAIKTLATFGEEAIPALVEITNQSSNREPQQLARAKIREINQSNQTNHKKPAVVAEKSEESSPNQMSEKQDSEEKSEASEGNL